MMHRCELAEALLYTPVADALGEEHLTLERLLGLTSEQALDPTELWALERHRWPTAQCPAGLSASIAAEVWPRYCASGDEGVDFAAGRIAADVQRRQLISKRRGWLVFLRRDGSAVGECADRPGRVDLDRISYLECCGTRHEGGRLCALNLSRVITTAEARATLLGPLAAWPTGGFTP